MKMKKGKKIDPFKNLVLDDYEQEIENALENGEYVSVPNFEETKKELEEAAKRHVALRKSKRITIRVNQVDLIKVKAKAKRSNVPYQTLLNALIRQYAQGKTSVKL